MWDNAAIGSDRPLNLPERRFGLMYEWPTIHSEPRAGTSNDKSLFVNLSPNGPTSGWAVTQASDATSRDSGGVVFLQKFKMSPKLGETISVGVRAPRLRVWGLSLSPFDLSDLNGDVR